MSIRVVGGEAKSRTRRSGRPFARPRYVKKKRLFYRIYPSFLFEPFTFERHLVRFKSLSLSPFFFSFFSLATKSCARFSLFSRLNELRGGAAPSLPLRRRSSFSSFPRLLWAFFFLLCTFFLVFYKHIYAIIIPRIISSVIFFFFSFFFFLGVRNKRVGDTRRLKWKIFFLVFCTDWIAQTAISRRRKEKRGEKLYTLLFRADIWKWIKQVPREWFKKKKTRNEGNNELCKNNQVLYGSPFLKNKK